MGYSLEWECSGVVKRYHGQVNAAELVEPVVSTQSDARFDQLRYVINDFLGVQGMACTQDDIDVIAAHDMGAAVTNPNIRIAMVTCQPDVIALIQRYLQATGEVYPTRIFPTLAEARAWLEVSGA